jgi:hypothetical protein
MSDKTCEQMEDLLVDYADNELPAERRYQVETHLGDCEHCRRLLAALRHSEDVTRTVWQKAYDQVVNLRPADISPVRRRRPIYIGVATAAAIVLAFLTALTWRALLASGPRQPSPPLVNQPAIAVVLHLTPEQVRRNVNAAGTSIALLASVDWLAEQPANRQIACQQYEFITRMYAGTQAAERAKARLAALGQRSS